MVDLEPLRQWIGRTDRAEDVVTPRLAESLRATLDLDGPGVPATIHWCLAPLIRPTAELGPDGHPARGGFLPPVPLPRRMWAGGALELEDPLREGDTVERVSRVADVSVKTGRTGTLCFVTVEHEVSTARGLAVRERQDLVYRDLGAGGAAPGTAAPAATWQRGVMADAVRLFRYSALTFNGHRIHYDRAYCLEAEGYPGLVVHGPLQATLLVELAAEVRDGLPPRTFSFRGVRPLFDGAAFTVNAAEAENGLALWVADRDGAVTMTATAGW